MNYSTICECGPVCVFEEDPRLFMHIVQNAEVNVPVQAQRAQGVPVTAKLYGKLEYHAYILAVFRWLGRGNRRPPKSCLVELVYAKWPDKYASDYAGYHACKRHRRQMMVANQGQSII
jgi:hypothetical protein